MQTVKKTSLQYPKQVEWALSRISILLRARYRISKRSVGLLLLQNDPDIIIAVKENEPERFEEIYHIVRQIQGAEGESIRYRISMSRQNKVRRIASAVTQQDEKGTPRFRERLSRAMMRPLTGIPILAAVLYFGLYQFVGVLGAGFLVDFFEGIVFGEWINPRLSSLVMRTIPVEVIQNLLIGEYGIITLGLSYALAIILPIVGTFFFVFSIIEDSGYLPRLAMLIDRTFKKIGLNGRAVIPMVLGFGCDTMATIVTRTQETTRERVLTTLLLALAIPCSAQLGVVLGILSSNAVALAIWISVVGGVFLLVGVIASKIVPGKKASFYMELPPLRLPRISNILIKTYTRLRWYLFEVIPLFLLASVILWLGDLTGVFALLVQYVMEPLVTFIGLPPETAVAFFFGFFRRDFGAAGLYDLHTKGILSGVPLVVAAVTLTLFLPCVAQIAVMFKERGLKTTLAISGFVFPFAFAVGFLLNTILTGLGVSL